MNGEEAYALSKALTAQAAAGLKNYQISDTGLLTMETSDGRVLSYQFREPEDGVSVVSVVVNENAHLIVTYSDGQEDDAGLIPTVKGDPGKDGLGVKSVKVDADNHLIVTYDNETTHDAGEIKTDDLQFESLPEASAENEGCIYQYIGPTTLTYNHGYFYECISDGLLPPTYSWVQKNVQPGGGGSDEELTPAQVAYLISLL